MSKFLCLRLGRNEGISDEELRSRLSDINHQCFGKISKHENSRYRRVKALRGLKKILREVDRDQLQKIEPDTTLSCSVRILADSARALTERSKTCEWKRRRDYKMANECYRDVLRALVPEKSRETIDTLIAIINREGLWHSEYLCRELIDGATEENMTIGETMNALLDCIETKKPSTSDARSIVRILYEKLNDYSWPRSDETVATIERLLKIYYGSLKNSNDGVSLYGPLRKGLELCLRNVIKNLTNDHLLVIVYHMCAWSIVDDASDRTILDYGSNLEYAAYRHVTRWFDETLNEKIFPLLMRMISSSNRLVSLLGNRVMHHLVDRRDNKSHFLTPRIFLENTHYAILRLENCEKRDKLFIRMNREILHDSLVKGAMRHSSTRSNLESVYCTVCLLAVEIPCGFTAATIVCLAMNLQDIAVNKIMTERAEWSPHLNPPLKSRYSHPVHHVLWDKPELFFVDWEARYGLWKCFRQRLERPANDRTN